MQILKGGCNNGKIGKWVIYWLRRKDIIQLSQVLKFFLVVLRVLERKKKVLKKMIECFFIFLYFLRLVLRWSDFRCIRKKLYIGLVDILRK